MLISALETALQKIEFSQLEYTLSEMLTYELNLQSSTMKLQDHKIISIKFLL